MSEPAKRLNYSTEVESFLDTLFEGQEGFVYVPTKNPATGHWQPYFFTYPEQRDDIVTHVMDASKTKEAYLSPSLFTKSSAERENWKGSNYVWVEFDGNAPAALPKGVPNPTIKVQSSSKGHEHWYWRLNAFETEKEVVQGLSRRLAYTLNADKSGWDANQVLRPPGTLHHDTKRRVRLLSSENRVVSITDFVNLVETPPEVVVNTNITSLPDVQTVVQKYKFGTDARDLFSKSKQPTGSRSSAMMRMAFHCIEMGMTNEEAYAVLLNCDDRWGKYKNRTVENRAKVLTGMIAHARNEKAIQAEIRLSEYEPMYTINELLSLDFSKIDWIYNEVLADNSIGVVAADPNVGKTSLSFQLGIHVALNKEFLGWEPNLEHGLNVGIFEFEMDTRQSGHFLQNMVSGLTPLEREILNQRFRIRPTGYAIPLDKPVEQQKILDYIDQHELNFIVIDSLKAVTGLDEKRSDNFFNFINKEVRAERGCTVWLIHHNRKAGSDGRVGEQTLDDLYGDVFISAHASTVIGLRSKSKVGDKIEVASLKSRLAPPFSTFRIQRHDNMSFMRVGKEATEDESSTTKSAISGHFKL